MAYKEAIQEQLSTISSSNNTNGEYTIAIVGAGRGPIVISLVQALSKIPHFPLKRIFLVEKNPSCRFNLQHMLDNNKQVIPFSQNITILSKDIRLVQNSDTEGLKFDLVISEMIGSFGCNEMAPEILSSFTQ